MRFNELRETLQLRLSGEFKRFADEELRAVLTLLAGSTLRWIADGGFQISNRTPAGGHQRLRAGRDPDVAGGRTPAPLAGDEERFVLLAMHQTLEERGL